MCLLCIGKVDQNYLYEVLSNIDLNNADALFVSCTALPVLPIIDKLEKKLKGSLDSIQFDPITFSFQKKFKLWT